MSINALSSNYYNQYQTSNGYQIKNYDPTQWQTTTTTTATTATCEDGSDDGKISFGSKVKNFFKGIGNTIKGAVKSLATPKGFLKAAACVALCAIPGVGPFAAVALGAVGVVKGAKTLVNGAKAAHNATTDAEAEAAWQNIGSGSFQVAASAVATKAGIKGIKAQGGISQTASLAKSSVKNIASKAKNVATTAKESFQFNRTFGNGVVKSAAGAAKDSLNKVGINTEAIAVKAGELKAGVKDAVGTAKESYGINRTFGNGVVKSAAGAAKDSLNKVGINTEAITTKASDLKAGMKDALGTAKESYGMNRTFGNGVVKSAVGAAKDTLGNLGVKAEGVASNVASKTKDVIGTAKESYGMNRTFGNGVVKSAAGAAKDGLANVSGSKFITTVSGKINSLNPQKVMTASTVLGVEAGDTKKATTTDEQILTTAQYDPELFMTGYYN